MYSDAPWSSRYSAESETLTAVPSWLVRSYDRKSEGWNEMGKLEQAITTHNQIETHLDFKFLPIVPCRLVAH
jgi:hypothetical protein